VLWKKLFPATVICRDCNRIQNSRFISHANLPFVTICSFSTCHMHSTLVQTKYTSAHERGSVNIYVHTSNNATAQVGSNVGVSVFSARLLIRSHFASESSRDWPTRSRLFAVFLIPRANDSWCPNCTLHCMPQRGHPNVNRPTFTSK
jgi:hypothetical protein